MNIVVLNGSPKGELSTTMQSVRFLEKKLDRHTFNIIHVAQRMAAVEKKSEAFTEILEAVAGADAVIWGTPVYVCLVPSQLMRFIELIFERNVQHLFEGKYAGVLTTSIRFFDHLAHQYLQGICDDLKMKVAGTFSADSYDLLDESEQSRLLAFAGHFLNSITHKIPVSPRYVRCPDTHAAYVPQMVVSPMGKVEGNIMVITDQLDDTTNVGRMIRHFCRCFADQVTVLDLETDVKMSGGCLGCVQCGFDHICVYAGKDDFIRIYEDRIMSSDMILFAGEIRHRFFSAGFKQFFDRAFFKNHTPTLVGKQIGFLISGPLSHNQSVREFCQAYTEWQGANLVDIVTDESGDAKRIDAEIVSLASRMVAFHTSGYVSPNTFLGVGGRKIFRDDIWGRHRFVFQADHVHFEKNRLYDFPQDDKRAIETNKIMFEKTSTPEGREAVRRGLAREMVRPHQKKVAQA